MFCLFVCFVCFILFYAFLVVLFVIIVFLSNLYSKDREIARGEHDHSLTITPPNSGIVM